MSWWDKRSRYTKWAILAFLAVGLAVLIATLARAELEYPVPNHHTAKMHLDYIDSIQPDYDWKESGVYFWFFNHYGWLPPQPIDSDWCGTVDVAKGPDDWLDAVCGPGGWVTHGRYRFGVDAESGELIHSYMILARCKLGGGKGFVTRLMLWCPEDVVYPEVP